MWCPQYAICNGGKKPRVAYLSMEMLQRDFHDSFRRLGQRGGLGVLAGDTADELEQLTDLIDPYIFTPLYAYPWSGPRGDAVSYQALGWREHNVQIEYEGVWYTVQCLHISDRRIGIANPAVFDVLYTDDRGARLRQQVIFSKAVTRYLAETQTMIDIVWQNESHVAPIVPFLNQVYPQTKSLFTIHTQQQSGMERYDADRFSSTGIPGDCAPIYVPWNNGVMDFTFASMAQAHQVNAVSVEHAGITQRMFPWFRSKVVPVTNGVSSQWRDPKLRPHVNGTVSLSLEQLMVVHRDARERLDAAIERETLVRPDADKPLFGFIRRSQEYKNFPLVTELLSAITGKRGDTVQTHLGTLRGLGLQVVIASVAPESDGVCMGWMNDFARLASGEYRSQFFHIQKYDLELLEVFAQGLDCHIEAPKPGEEACGTSGMRNAENGIPTIASVTGGMREYITPVDGTVGEGNGWFVEPYTTRSFYEQCADFSDRYYAWKEYGSDEYPQIMRNALRKSIDLDIRKTLVEGYIPLLNRMIFPQ